MHSIDLQDCLDAFAQDSNEGQDEHSVFLAPLLEATTCWQTGVFRLEDLLDLDAPFVLQFADAQQCRAHYCDDDAGDNGKYTFPDVLCSFKGVVTCCVDYTV
jgi:hypothetical protein